VKILIVSHQYFPVIGGVPVVARLLAQGFLEHGAEVRLVTATPSREIDEPEFPVYRTPGPLQLIGLFSWAELVVMIGPSIRLGWPLLLARRPLIVSHQAGVPSGWLQRALARKAVNVACSNYLAERLGGNAKGIANPFDYRLFKGDRSRARDRDFIFVGRLIHEKGADIFLRALGNLERLGIKATGTIVGTGEQEGILKQLAHDLGLANRVTFTGALKGREIVEAMQRHHVGVMPSRWPEPFGIVALELIASGCVVIGARVGGIPEAIGDCGVRFTSEDDQELASVMRRLIVDDIARSDLLKNSVDHLAKSEPRCVAACYMNVLSRSHASRT
jgi:glycosyltransferase involved in cell wall biosynthesis